MFKLIHNRKLTASIALCVAAIAVASLWVDDQPELGSESGETRSARHSVNNQKDGDTRAAYRKSPHQDNASAAKELHPGAPHRIQRTNGADKHIIARGSSGKSDQASGNRTAKRGKGARAKSSNRLAMLLSASSLTASQRVANLESLGSSPLSEEERKSAYDYLADTPAIAGVSTASQHWIVDELITALRGNGADNKELTSRLAEVYHKNDDMVIRDYALQHLGHIRNEGGDIQLIDSTLMAATNEQQGTLAGTAILALNAQSKNDATLTATTQQKALSIVGNSGYDIRSRISALQVAGQHGSQDILPKAIEIATNATQPVPLRMASIATLADLRAIDQQPVLLKLSQSSDHRLRTAAKAALQKLTTENK